MYCESDYGIMRKEMKNNYMVECYSVTAWLNRVYDDGWQIYQDPKAATQVMFCARYIESLEAENAKLEKLNSAALERLSYHACPSVPSRNNYGQPCNDSDDCVACWREYLGGKDE